MTYDLINFIVIILRKDRRTIRSEDYKIGDYKIGRLSDLRIIKSVSVFKSKVSQFLFSKLNSLFLTYYSLQINPLRILDSKYNSISLSLSLSQF